MNFLREQIFPVPLFAQIKTVESSRQRGSAISKARRIPGERPIIAPNCPSVANWTA